MTILAAILFLGALVFIHEVGHFLVGKLFGVDAPVLSFGFGRRLVGIRWRGTDYRISLIPFGGYVRFRGADPYGDEEPDSDEAYAPGSLLRAPVWQKLLIYIAGPAFNLILPYFLFVVLLLSGEPQPAARVGTVIQGSPAAAQGIQPGDRVLAVDGEPVHTWYEVLGRFGEVAEAGGGDLALTWERGGRQEVSHFTLKGPEEGRTPSFSRDVGLSSDVPSSQAGVDDPDSPAGRAGLRTGDRIKWINGQAVGDWLAVEAALDAASQSLQVEAEREGKPVSFTVLDPMTCDPPQERCDRWGLSTASLFVASVSEDTPAHAAGLQALDHVLAVDGVPMGSWADLLGRVAATAPAGEKESTPTGLVLTVRRQGQEIQVPVTPSMTRDTDRFGRYYYRPVLGLVRLGEIEEGPLVSRKYPLSEAVVEAGEETVGLIRFTLTQVGRIVTGEVAPQESLGGPVEIMRQAKNAAEEGVYRLARLLGMISISVGIFNLLPVPVLDGGNILFYLIEAVRGRPVSAAVRERLQMVGVMLLMALMLFVLAVDVNRLFTGE